VTHKKREQAQELHVVKKAKTPTCAHYSTKAGKYRHRGESQKQGDHSPGTLKSPDTTNPTLLVE